MSHVVVQRKGFTHIDVEAGNEATTRWEVL
jgi:hypothetical protein